MRKYSYRVWDKESSINNRSAKKWLELYPYFQDGDVIVISVDEVDSEVLNFSSIKSILDMHKATQEEVMTQYINNLINEREQEPVYIQNNNELKMELSQAKLLLMKEGLL